MTATDTGAITEPCPNCGIPVPAHCDGSGEIICSECNKDVGHELCGECMDIFEDDDGGGGEERIAA